MEMEREKVKASLSTADVPPDRELPSFKRAKELLRLAQEVEEMVELKGWKWCDLRQVYHILESIHG